MPSLQGVDNEFGETGEWLSQATESAWQAAALLIKIPPLAGVLGDRHRIITNDWQTAHMSSLAARMVSRALKVLEQAAFSPRAIRTDLKGPRVFPHYLYST